jgi:hypothetical protein
MKWDEWRGSKWDDEQMKWLPTFYSKTFFRMFGWKFCLHKFVAADEPDCFHTHPANAIRIVLWGGYEEEVWYDEPRDVEAGTELVEGRVFRKTKRTQRERFRVPAGYTGLVRPAFAHRIHKLSNGKVSYSLWLRFKITHDVHMVGPGWGK